MTRTGLLSGVVVLALLNGCALLRGGPAGGAPPPTPVSVSLVEARCYLDDHREVDLRVVFRVTNNDPEAVMVHPADVQLMSDDKHIPPDLASPDGVVFGGTERLWTIHFTQERGFKCAENRILIFAHAAERGRQELPLPPLTFRASLADD